MKFLVLVVLVVLAILCMITSAQLTGPTGGQYYYFKLRLLLLLHLLLLLALPPLLALLHTRAWGHIRNLSLSLKKQSKLYGHRKEKSERLDYAKLYTKRDNHKLVKKINLERSANVYWYQTKKDFG